jgi:hypothetical protein
MHGQQFVLGGLLILGAIFVLVALSETHHTPIQQSSGEGRSASPKGSKPAIIVPEANCDALQQELDGCHIDLQHLQSQMSSGSSGSQHASLSRGGSNRAGSILGPSAGEWPRRSGRDRVIIAGFPSSGTDVLRRFITELTGAPTFSVYNEGNTAFTEQTDIDPSVMQVWSNCWDVEDCDLNDQFPVIVKTQFPAVMMQSNLPTYNKIIRIIRNPFDNIESFFRQCKEISWLASRIRDWPYHIKNEIKEYKKFHTYWQRVEQSGEATALILRYEDLCESPLSTIREVLDFLDISHLVSDQMISSAAQRFACDVTEQIGGSIQMYTAEQAEQVEGGLASLLHEYDFDHLIDSFNEAW